MRAIHFWASLSVGLLVLVYGADVCSTVYDAIVAYQSEVTTAVNELKLVDADIQNSRYPTLGANETIAISMLNALGPNITLNNDRVAALQAEDASVHVEIIVLEAQARNVSVYGENMTQPLLNYVKELNGVDAVILSQSKTIESSVSLVNVSAINLVSVVNLFESRVNDSTEAIGANLLSLNESIYAIQDESRRLDNNSQNHKNDIQQLENRDVSFWETLRNWDLNVSRLDEVKTMITESPGENFTLLLTRLSEISSKDVEVAAQNVLISGNLSSMWQTESQLWNKTSGINRTRLLELEAKPGPLYGTYEEIYSTEDIYVSSPKTDPSTNSDIKRFSERAKDVAILVSSFMVLFACIGTRMVEIGSVLSTDVRMTTLRILFEFSIASFGFLLIGQTFFDGDDDHGLVGLETTFVDSHDFVRLAFMMSLVFLGVSLFSGSVAGRARFVVHGMCAFVFSSFVFPLSAHWLWAKHGVSKSLGVIDLFGVSVVQIPAGMMSWMCSWCVGPRLGRFDKKYQKLELVGYSSCFRAIGSILQQFGLSGAVVGMSCLLDNDRNVGVVLSQTIHRALSNCIIGGCVGFLSFLLSDYVLLDEDDENMTRRIQRTTPSEIELWVCCRGGVTSMLAGAHVFEPIPSVIVAFFGGVIALLTHRQFAWSHTIDDVVSSVATNLVSGTWGLLSVGLFAATSFVGTTSSSHDQSLLESGTFDLMWKQAAVVVAECLLSAIFTLATLGFIRIFVPSLRSSLKVEGQSLNLVRKLHFREVVGPSSQAAKSKRIVPMDHDNPKVVKRMLSLLPRKR
eukprot:TRINITY_DN669_c2_g1_i1.p1 TRINITY_DN669_c2_g1~~TRINITY_DN669_c2_g1_i1.p1  ORF type:complete len:797 (-),score=153.17 TRINITY_DN669_c2_g1_i1:3482-5872(-)